MSLKKTNEWIVPKGASGRRKSLISTSVICQGEILPPNMQKVSALCNFPQLKSPERFGAPRKSQFNRPGTRYALTL